MFTRACNAVPSALKCAAGLGTTHEKKARLDVERVFFAPPGSDRQTIKGVSFTLEPGTWLGLIGPSASGKSTLAKLICGVWQPRSGSIRLDGSRFIHKL